MIAMAETRRLRGEMRLGESMAGYTSWRAGGPAARLYRPADAADLAAFLAGLPEDEALLWVGLGSNLLVRDGGFRGTVVLTQGRLTGLQRLDGARVRAESGVACAKVARFAAHQGLCGVEFLAGIPGTLGGALAMNAGAFGGETWQRVVEVETLDRRGQLHRRLPGDFRIGYREVRGAPDEWFFSASLALEPGDTQAGQARIRSLLERRAQTQPTSQASCGSVFRNPPGDHAARLIEAAGLKGSCIGAACVSTKHANFIINTGDASAADIERLIERVRETVERASGIRLCTEVHIVGEVD